MILAINAFNGCGPSNEIRMSPVTAKESQDNAVLVIDIATGVGSN